MAGNPLKSPARMAAVGTESVDRDAGALHRPFEAPKKNSLSLMTGPPRVPPKMLKSISASRWGTAGKVARLQRFVIVVVEGRAVELVRAGLGDHRDRGAARHALLGVEVAGGDVDRVDGLRRRHVDRVVRQPDEDVGGAVELGVVAVARGAVDVRGQRAGGCRADAILEVRREWRRAPDRSGSGNCGKRPAANWSLPGVVTSDRTSDLSVCRAAASA